MFRLRAVSLLFSKSAREVTQTVSLAVSPLARAWSLADLRARLLAVYSDSIAHAGVTASVKTQLYRKLE